MNNKLPNLTLTYLKQISIQHESEGLTEPSGVVLTHTNKSLWVVSDDKKRLFQIDLNGQLIPEATISTPDKGLEGLTLDREGNLYLVSEGQNKIIVLDAQGNLLQQQKLKNIDGYKKISKYFDKSNHKNKGLEGITICQDYIFALKEGKPGLLIKISQDLTKIKDYKKLSDKNGFSDDQIKSKQIDYSGICYDPSRHCFWIVSDRAKRLFLYSWKKNRVLQSFALGYQQNGEYRKIEKAEGVTYNPDTQRLYIVNDLTARLYTYAIH